MDCKHVLITVTLGFMLALLAEAEVSYEKPDLSAFKLRHVNAKQLARKRAEEPISELASGAVFMRQSLFVNEPLIRCASYARLFSLIKAQTNKKLYQNTVESLAIIAAQESDFYGHLLASNANSVAPLMIEAVEKLEKRHDQESKAAWLDLIGCLRYYLNGQPDVEQFLQVPERQSAVDSLKTFNSIPVPQSTNGVVKYLANRINGEPIKGRSIHGRYVSDDLFNRAKTLIESLDDAKTKKARAEFAKHPEEAQNLTPVHNQDMATPEPTKEQVVGVEEQVELVVPTEESNEKAGDQFNMAQLEALEFVKSRLESKTGERDEPKLSVQLALDFQSHWEDLKNYKIHLDPVSALGRRAIPFVEDPANEEIAKRIDAAIGTYTKLVGVLAEIKIREGKMKHVNELGQQVKRLAKLLEQMDPAFDVDNLRRLYEQWRAKYQEYSTVFDRLILRASK